MGGAIELVEGPIWLGDSKIKGFKISIVSRWLKFVICALSIRSNNFLISEAPFAKPRQQVADKFRKTTVIG
ncbi:hypothetical protein SAMN05216283_105216 [Sunxiuqinia elliptica]|uniref:Uncharacterized protein n=1 Tax=Sunxiuqinia elliptica TaxID=655355 RepID=A0A1I2IBX9_9BACT|nr:hypothetical protein SAMN05216283_105216 [Sunxiuqinia elliptica]